jgi:hypothetical protein
MSFNGGAIVRSKSASVARIEDESSNSGRDIARASIGRFRLGNARCLFGRIPGAACTAFLLIMASTMAAAQGTCPTSPNYEPDFSSNGNCLQPNVDAALVSDGTTVLQITTSAGAQFGSAWYLTPQTVINGFSTTFQFQFTNPSTPPADGIAFLIQNSSTSAIGFASDNDGGALGYGDFDGNDDPSQGQGIPSSVAIEFDSYYNYLWDPAPVNGVDSHVAIQSCGTGPNTSHHNYLCNGTSGPNSTLGQPVSTENSGINFADGNIHTVTINYTPTCSTCNPATVANLQVYVDSLNVYPNGIPVDLSTIASPQGTAYVGFTGATGSDFETQDILNWTFAPTQQGTTITTQTLSQTFTMSSAPNQTWTFNFDDTTANNSGTLTIQQGTIPYINSSGISPTDWATIVSGTAMADAPCLLSAIDPTVCAVNTMTCTTSEDSTPEGSNCPTSTVRNILFDQQIDLAQTQPGIVSGTLTIPSGYAPGMAMAPDAVVTGGQCTYPSGGPLASQTCPQSILTQLEDNTPKPGGTGSTTNSSYVFFCCAPEWSTSPAIAAWNNTTSVPASFTSTPPPTPNPDPNGFHAAQGASVVVGAEPHGTILDTTYPLPAEQTLTTLNGTPIPQCPALGVPPATPWSTQNPQTFSVNGTITSYDNNGTASPLTEGAYDAHYFSVDCDAFEELVFPATLSVVPGTPGTNVASFKIQPFNIDLTPPIISNVVLNPGSSVPYGSTLTAAITCVDSVSNGVASGVSNCGGQATVPQSYPPLTTTPTVTVNVPLPTNVLGQQNYAVPGPVDQAGNLGSGTNIQYTVTVAAATITLSNLTQVYTGTPLSPAVTTSPANLPYQLTGAPDTSPGVYPVTATITGGDYTGSTNGSFVITTAQVVPTNINFGDVPVNTTVTAPVTVTNVGTTILTVDYTVVPGGTQSDFWGTDGCKKKKLAPGAHCVITVHYHADSDDFGTGVGNTLYIYDSAPGSPQAVTLFGMPIKKQK